MSVTPPRSPNFGESGESRRGLPAPHEAISAKVANPFKRRRTPSPPPDNTGGAASPRSFSSGVLVSRGEESIRAIAMKRFGEKGYRTLSPPPPCGGGVASSSSEVPVGFSAYSPFDRQKPCPPAPKRGKKPPERSSISLTPFESNLQAILSRVKVALSSNGQFPLEISPGRTVMCENIEALSSEGQHSLVYKVDLLEENGKSLGPHVLKLPKEGTTEQQRIFQFAEGLIRYAQNMKNPLLKKFTAPHLTFDPLIPDVYQELNSCDYRNLGQIQGLLSFVLSIVMKKPNVCPILLVPLYKRLFDLTTDSFNWEEKDSNLWYQLKIMHEESSRKFILNDIRRPNLAIDTDEKGNKRIINFDMMERYLEEAERIEELDPKIFNRNHAETFFPIDEDEEKRVWVFGVEPRCR